MYSLEPITTVNTINYDNPLSRDFQSFHYKPIESCDEYSYGILIHIHYKTPYVYATRFENEYVLYLSREKADKAYRDELNSILEIIRNQADSPF